MPRIEIPGQVLLAIWDSADTDFASFAAGPHRLILQLKEPIHAKDRHKACHSQLPPDEMGGCTFLTDLWFSTKPGHYQGEPIAIRGFACPAAARPGYGRRAT